MARFNRNVIINADVRAWADPSTPTPRTLDAAPPAGAISSLGAAAPAAAGGPPAAGAQPAVPTADDYMTRLLKYVPMEVVGAYLLVSGLVSSNVDDVDVLRGWLLGLLIATLALTAPYVMRVLGVVRVVQAALSVVGIGVYAFAMGGWFATFDWYEPWHGTIALVAFGLLVSLVKLSPLPPATP